ncbi:hypothetical protein SCLCIDRAFT_1213078 [Scleroderma citrinum Foug A]|uniref:Uncharacterized protein n=1 Tax=Scleroderma citrinum Foug A TaxID=1036808 RepID=A0A0C3E847_9AGAM|nr:hypothetical protein SCLCIDRAFT_1213078 [Scleroderma citrinum Foug A]
MSGRGSEPHYFVKIPPTPFAALSPWDTFNQRARCSQNRSDMSRYWRCNSPTS